MTGCKRPESIRRGVHEGVGAEGELGAELRSILSLRLASHFRSSRRGELPLPFSSSDAALPLGSLGFNSGEPGHAAPFGLNRGSTPISS